MNYIWLKSNSIILKLSVKIKIYNDTFFIYNIRNKKAFQNNERIEKGNILWVIFTLILTSPHHQYQSMIIINIMPGIENVDITNWILLEFLQIILKYIWELL